MTVKFRISFLLTFLFLVISSCSTDTEIGPDNRPLGVSARSFLSDENYTALEVEIVYVTGYEPTANSLSTVKAFLQKYLNKPNGITISTRAIPTPQMGTYSLKEIRSIEDKHRTLFTNGNTLTTFIFIADNKSDSSTSQDLNLGTAYGNTSMVIYQQEIRELALSSNEVSSEEIQYTTIKHEFGHLFGLVNNGTPAQTEHEDSAHCSIDGCLMAASLDFGNSSLSTLESQTGNLEFDEHCHRDLIANGGK